MTQPRHEGEVGEERGRLPPHNCALGSKKPRFRDLEPEEDGWGWKIHMESWMGRKTPSTIENDPELRATLEHTAHFLVER